VTACGITVSQELLFRVTNDYKTTPSKLKNKNSV
jgi:hypothetical protein